MFRHILIPVDGSAPATRAAKAGVAFARRIGARVTVYHAINPIPYGFYATGAEPGDTISLQLERSARAQGEKYVAPILRAARIVPVQDGGGGPRRGHRRLRASLDRAAGPLKKLQRKVCRRTRDIERASTLRDCGTRTPAPRSQWNGPWTDRGAIS